MSFLASLRPKCFAQQNLGTGGIHFRRAREIRKGSRKIEDFASPGVRRHKCFAEQNLGAGGIQFRRAREIRKGSRKIEDFVGMRRESGVPSVLRSKTLAQVEFSSAEQEKGKKGSRKIEDFVGKFDPDRKGDLSGSVRKMKNDLGGSCQYKKREMRRGEEWIIPQTSGHHRWEPARWTCQQSVPVRLPAHGERPWRAPRDADKPVPVPVRFQWCRTHRKR